MKYISQDSQQPLPSPHNGYWVKDQIVYDVSESSHIAFLLDHAKLFSISLEEIKEAYSNCGELFGSDGGKAREYLIRSATRSGWIRVRRYERPDYWSIQCNDTAKQRKEVLAFIQWAIESEIMKPDDPAVVLGFENKDDHHYLTWSDGGLSKF